MKCEKIQINLLDYARGRLSQPESEEVREHIAECSECATLLEEEKAFAQQLESIPSEQPANDVWAMVSAQTKPKRVSPLVALRDLTRSGYRKAAAVAVLAMLLVAGVFYSLVPPSSNENKRTEPVVVSTQSAQMKWSDDPLGTQTDAMIDYVDSM